VGKNEGKARCKKDSCSETERKTSGKKKKRKWFECKFSQTQRGRKTKKPGTDEGKITPGPIGDKSKDNESKSP